MIAMIGIFVGVLIAGAGIYYLTQNKNDPESRRIYGITAAAGVVVAAVCAVMLIL